MTEPPQDSLKRAAARRAVAEVEDGMVVGLGSGSTAAFALEGLAERITAGLRIAGIPPPRRRRRWPADSAFRSWISIGTGESI